MYPSEIIVVSDDDSEEEVLNDTSSADEKCYANIATKSPIIINGSHSINNELQELKEDNDEFINDDDYHHRLMQELSSVLAVSNLNFDRQNSCPSTLDADVYEPSYENIFTSKDTQSNDSSDGNHIHILKVESLSEWEGQCTDNQSEKFIPPVDDENSGAILEENFIAVHPVIYDQFESSNSEVQKLDLVSDFESGSSETFYSSKDDLCVKSQITRHELDILHKYLPVVQLTKVFLPNKIVNPDDINTKQLQIDNINGNDDVELSQVRNDDQKVFEFECKTCRKTCHSKDSFRKRIKYHIKRIHTMKRPFACSHRRCKFAGATSQDLKRHIKMKHSTNNYYKCTTCNFKSFSLRCLNNHLRRVHNDKAPYTCTECSYSSTNLRVLNVHMNHHFAKETYHCSECTYSTKCKSELRCHIEIHTSKKYKCRVCGSQFVKKESLSKHKHDHHTAFPVNQTAKCEFCEETFTNKYNKKLHLITHKNKNLYKCNLCIYITSSVGQFKKHTEMHTFNKWFICDECSKFFHSKNLLLQHRLNFHGENNN